MPLQMQQNNVYSAKSGGQGGRRSQRRGSGGGMHHGACIMGQDQHWELLPTSVVFKRQAQWMHFAGSAIEKWINPQNCVRYRKLRTGSCHFRVMSQSPGTPQTPHTPYTNSSGTPGSNQAFTPHAGDEHTNIMGQLECCTDEENIYSVMKFCKGGELFDYIDENGPMEEPQAKQMFRQLINGLIRLSELGIGHRDMSLENILYDAKDLYVVIDFGMCVRLKRSAYGEHQLQQEAAINAQNGHYGSSGNTSPRSPRTRSLIDHNTYCHIAKQTICGKKNYISPEVLRGDDYFNPLLCDIWATGIILFIALTGVPPVDKATHADERYSMICENRLGEMLEAWNMDVSPHAVDLMQVC
eukprot:gene29975-37119_t